MSQRKRIGSKSLFDLPTYQRRLRHLRSIAVRNLVCNCARGKDITRLQSYFSLHIDPSLPAFYKSEIITASLNPTWQSFDISRFEEEIDTQAKLVVVKVWVRGGGHGEKFKLLLDWTIHLSGLVFFAEKLQQDVLKYGTNTLIVGMFDKFFIAPDITKRESHAAINVDISVLRNSYNINSLSRIHTVLRAIKQTQASVKRVHRSIEDKLLSSQEKSKKLSCREDSLMKVDQLRSELTWKSMRLQAQKDDYYKLKHSRENAGELLRGKFSGLSKNKGSLQEKRKTYFQTRERYIKENAQLVIRRKQLVNELTTYIYPITEDPISKGRKHLFLTQKSSKVQKMNKLVNKNGKQLYICGVMLPNSEEFTGKDEVMCSVALDYTCHLIMMISEILDFPMRYPVQHKGSRSMITDHIHPKLTEKDRDFPLFSKGKEKFQFNYGVFLLNKNISQLRFYCGLGTEDLRLTLPNIKTMLERRLGVKFDNLSSFTQSTDHVDGRDRISNPSNELERLETNSSLASGGRVSAPDPSDQVFEALLQESKKNSRRQNSNSKLTNSHVEVLYEITGSSQGSMGSSVGEVFEESETLLKTTEDQLYKVPTPVTLGVETHENLSDSSSERLQYSEDISNSPKVKTSSLAVNGDSKPNCRLGVVFSDNQDGQSQSGISCDLSSEDDLLDKVQESSPSVNCDITNSLVSGDSDGAFQTQGHKSDTEAKLVILTDPPDNHLVNVIDSER